MGGMTPLGRLVQAATCTITDLSAATYVCRTTLTSGRKAHRQTLRAVAVECVRRAQHLLDVVEQVDPEALGGLRGRRRPRRER